MKAHRKEKLCNESLDEIRQELSLTNLAQVSDEEYIDLLTRHTSSLINLLEKLNVEAEAPEDIESSLKILFDTMNEPVCAIDNQSRIFYFNSYWAKEYTGSRTGHLLTDALPRHNGRQLKDKLLAASHTGRGVLFSLESGNEIGLLSIVPFRNLQGQVNFLLFIIGEDKLFQLWMKDDINRLNSGLPLHVNENIANYGRVEEDTCRSILETVDGFYFTLNSDYSLQFISPAITVKLGYAAKKLIGKQFGSLLTKESWIRLEEYLPRMTGSGRSPAIHMKSEVEFIDNKRRSRIFDLTLTTDKEHNRILGLCVDIHTHKLRELDLLTLKNTAELNDKLKSEFLANMSHEIRTPLNGIIGFSTMLGRDDLLDEKREKYLRIINSSTDHLLTLVSDIIDISKIEAGQLRILFNKVDIHQMLEDLQATWVAEAKRMDKKKIRLIKQIENHSSGLFIRSDEVRLKQVLNNLIGNALKFTCSGNICFGYTIPDQETIRFFVKDSGSGLSKSAQKTIFHRFKQTSEGVKDKYKGTGLGLAISKGIIDLMGGEIGVQSQTGKGSEFFFTLPLTRC
jgi:PAS domain S-box-containing protein